MKIENTVPNVSLLPSLLIALFKSILSLSFSPLLSSFSFIQTWMEVELFSIHPVLSLPPLPFSHYIICNRGKGACTEDLLLVVSVFEKSVKYLIYAIFIMNAREREREREHKWRMNLVPPGRRECKLSKRAVSARTEQQKRGFTLPKKSKFS